MSAAALLTEVQELRQEVAEMGDELTRMRRIVHEFMGRPAPIPEPTAQTDAEVVIEEVSQRFAMTSNQLRTDRRRSSWVVRARHVAMRRLRNECRLSFPEIGRIMGCDHSTVINAVYRSRHLP